MNISDLREGKAYFMCMYAHPKYPIPEITPYVFKGYDGVGYRFQSPDKYIGQKALSSLSQEAKSELEIYFSGDDMYVTEPADIEIMFETVEGLKIFIENLASSEFYEEFY